MDADDTLVRTAADRLAAASVGAASLAAPTTSTRREAGATTDDEDDDESWYYEDDDRDADERWLYERDEDDSLVWTAADRLAASAVASSSSGGAASTRREVRAAATTDDDADDDADEDVDENWYYYERDEDDDEKRSPPAWLSSTEPLQLIHRGLLRILDVELQRLSREGCTGCQKMAKKEREREKEKEKAAAGADKETVEPAAASAHQCFRGGFHFHAVRCRFNTLVPRVLTPDLAPRLRRYLKLHPCVPAIGDERLLAVVATMLHALKWTESISDEISAAYGHMTLFELAALDGVE